MPRPSQCLPCGLYEACLHPQDRLCAERLERDEIEQRRKEQEMARKPIQQYSTRDGSVWEPGAYSKDGIEFIRIASPDRAHENDFRPQSLAEVIRTWGSLSLHDPYSEELVHLVTTLSLVSHHSEPETFAKRLQAQFRTAGLKLVLESELDD